MPAGSPYLPFFGVILILLSSPTAPADWNAGTELGGLTVDDGRRPCAEFAPECAYSMHSDGTANGTHVDVYQDLRAVSLEFDNQTLPTEGARIDASETYVEHPTFVVLDGALELVTAPIPTHYGVEYNETEIGLVYVGPSSKDPESGIQERTFAVASWGQGHGVGYRQIGPYYRLSLNSTDGYFRQAVGDGCVVHDTGCFVPHTEIISAWENATPSIRLGAQWDSFAITPKAAANASLRSPPVTNVSEATVNSSSWPVDLKLRAAGASHPQSSPWSQERPNAPAPESEREGRAAPVKVAAVDVPSAPPPLEPLVVAALAVTSWAAYALYSRFTEARALLDAPRRKAIVEIVKSQPGATLAEVVERVGVRRTAVLHHARLLEAHGLLVTRRVGRKLLFFPNQQLARQLGEEAARPSHAQAIMRLVKQGPVSRETLAGAIQHLPARTRRYWIERLQTEGLIEVTGRGRSAKIVACARLRDAAASPRQ